MKAFDPADAFEWVIPTFEAKLKAAKLKGFKILTGYYCPNLAFKADKLFECPYKQELGALQRHVVL
jgi:hypothetical protein